MEGFDSVPEPARKRVKVEIEGPIAAALTSLSADLPDPSIREASATAWSSTNAQTSGIDLPHTPDISAVYVSQVVELATKGEARQRMSELFNDPEADLEFGVCHRRRGENSDALICLTGS